MSEVEVTTDWFDTDTIRTRERMALLGGEADTNYGYIKNEPPGPEIDYTTEFVPIVLEPAKSAVHVDYDTNGVAAKMGTERWYDIAAGGIPPFIPSSYDTNLFLGSSVTHLHDPDVRGMLSDRALELRTAKAAELGISIDDVVLDWDFGGVDFPLFTYPIGTYANRMIEVTHNQTVGEKYDSDGNVLTDGVGFPTFHVADPISFYAIPVESPGGSDPDSGEVTDSGVEWGSGELQQRAAEDSRAAVFFVGQHLITVAAGGGGSPNTETADIDDTWWDAHAWTVTNPVTDYPTRGFPIAGGYDWTFIPNADTTAVGANDAGSMSSDAEVWFEADWTPPRHRFRYFLSGAMPPRRFRGRPDHLAGGAQRWAPHPKSIQAGRRWGGAVI